MKILLKESTSLSTALSRVSNLINNKLVDSKFTAVVNKPHKCVDVFCDDALLAQVYPGILDPREYKTTSLQQVNLSDIEDMSPDTRVYIKVPGTVIRNAYSSSLSNIMVKQVSNVGGIEALEALFDEAGKDSK